MLTNPVVGEDATHNNIEAILCGSMCAACSHWSGAQISLPVARLEGVPTGRVLVLLAPEVQEGVRVRVRMRTGGAYTVLWVCMHQ